MDRFLVSRCSMGLMGFALAGLGVSGFRSGGSTIGAVLAVVGGGALILVAGYEVVTSDPSIRSQPDVWVYRAVVFGAVLVVVGAGLQVASSLL